MTCSIYLLAPPIVWPCDLQLSTKNRTNSSSVSIDLWNEKYEISIQQFGFSIGLQSVTKLLNPFAAKAFSDGTGSQVANART